MSTNQSPEYRGHSLQIENFQPERLQFKLSSNRRDKRPQSVSLSPRLY